jgi:hypothetical protein
VNQQECFDAVLVGDTRTGRQDRCVVVDKRLRPVHTATWLPAYLPILLTDMTFRDSLLGRNGVMERSWWDPPWTDSYVPADGRPTTGRRRLVSCCGRPGIPNHRYRTCFFESLSLLAPVLSRGPNHRPVINFLQMRVDVRGATCLVVVLRVAERPSDMVRFLRYGSLLHTSR